MKSGSRVLLFSLLLVLGVGCGSSSGPAGVNSGDQKGGAGRMTIENTDRIVREQLDYNGVKQVFASNGEPTNDEKPGLLPGNKFVWKEDGKKVYVSFGPNGKANGVAWEGFGGK